VTFPYRIAELSPDHDRSTFSSGSPPLDRYIREQATQDIRRQVSKCFVIHETGAAAIAGYYTLAASSVPVDLLPDDLKRRLPRYPTVPVARIGRLAADRQHRGRKLGSTLVYDACQRASRAEMGVFALIVDAKDDQAEAFYRHYGFAAFAPAGW
jgi:ribosomal protein S18 acetylase RimI-like enzyme